MQYGLCNLGVIPLRKEPDDTSEMVSQVLYGDLFKITDSRKQWFKIRLAFDKYEGWIDRKQLQLIEEETYRELHNAPINYNIDLVEFVEDSQHNLFPIPIGANLNALPILKHKFGGNRVTTVQPKSHLIKTSFLYLNAPYLWGGKTPFGIDCSGFTQMVYKLNGYALSRDASQQASQGEALSFIEESEPGDLAFFDNNEGEIIHVGIIMKDNYIIHAHGKVRIDRLDHSGIYNAERREHTHKLRVIKKVV